MHLELQGTLTYCRNSEFYCAKLGGLFNLVNKSLDGAQVAGLRNRTNEVLAGVQVSGEIPGGVT